MRTIMMTALAAMLAVTSGFADQRADLMAELKGNPTEDFSGKDFNLLAMLGEADPMLYFQAHKERPSLSVEMNTAEAHALKHHLMGNLIGVYGSEFCECS